MKCLRCKTENKITSSHCETCGAPLRLRRRTDRYKKSKFLMILVVLLAWLAGFAYFFRDVLLINHSTSIHTSSIEREAMDHNRIAAKREQLAERLKAAMLSPGKQKNTAKGVKSAAGSPNATLTRQKGEEIVTGWVSIVDPWGRQITKLRAALAGNGWLALPSRVCLGGWKWNFYQDDGVNKSIGSGLWKTKDMVGLWHLAQNSVVGGPGLDVWNNEQPVDWFSLGAPNVMRGIRLTADSVQGDFVSCELPEGLNEIGIFVQDGNIVGWTFGQWLINGYMWHGTGGKELRTNVSVREFYDQTFAGGREEKFAKALAMDSRNAKLEQLTALVDAYKSPTKLAPEDTLYYLLPDEVVKRVQKLVDLEINAGNGNQVVKILNDEALKEIGDINLLMDVVPAVTSTRGFAAAVSLIEGTGRAIVQAGGKDVPRLNTLHAQLYKDWLQSLVKVRDVNQGMQIWKAASAYYPGDPYIHLLGVELFLLNNNWQAAERLLYSRKYPASLQDRYQVLASRISDMKGQEGKIVINFTPGADRIPVRAMLNATFRLDFMVDTGASMVTIPSDAADTLGLKIVHGVNGDHGNSSHIVSTAGGSVAADQVLIDTLEIDGWVEHNIRALVIDIPGQPGTGLLGLNYLQRFKMNLNNDSGSLTLTPK